jgi:hypothetical protein
MATVRALHILQQDLAQHKRTLEPIKAVVYGLRRYDTDRAAALVSEEDKLKGVEARGFMSQKVSSSIFSNARRPDLVHRRKSTSQTWWTTWTTY